MMRVLQTIRAVWHGVVTLSVATAGFALVSAVPGSTVVMAQDAGVLTGNISPLDSGEDVLLTADEVTFDEALGVVTATGNVQVSQGERTIYADRMSYSVRDDTVAASGNVVLIEPTGEVFFSDYVELGDELRNGVIRDIRVLFADDSRLAGSGARRTDGRESEVRNAVFSPCKVCAEDGDDPPLWQIKARRIVHDQEKKQIRYYDPRLEFFGVPVLYSPYLQHTDPSVKRETGLMAPTFQGDDNLGFFFKQPVYWAIDKDKDATFIPFIATKQGPGLAFEYRQAFTSGYLEFFGSATIADRDEEDLDTGFKDTREDRFRAHVDIEGRFDITEDWRWGFDIERATDRTYLALYEWPHEQILTSNLFVEGFQGRNYASANIWEFQGLRDIDDNKSAITPNILPVIDWDWTTDAFGFGGRLHANVNLFNVRRKKGSTNQRVVVSADYELPYTTKFGDQYKVTASLRGDFYQVQDVPSPTPPHEDSGTTGRFFPRLAVEWRYPFVQENTGFRQAFSPIFQGVVAPEGNNPPDIPNEDSQDFEFDDTNLLSLDRFTGYDLVDSGSRITYGGQWGLFTDGGRYMTFLVGQTFQPQENKEFEIGSGVSDPMSDIVGRVDLVPHKFIDINYRFRLNGFSATPRRNDVRVKIGAPIFYVSAEYFLLEEPQGEFGDRREEVSGTVGTLVGDRVTLNARHRRDLNQVGPLEYGAGFFYQDECFGWQFDWTRKFTRDEEVGESDSFFSRLVFKYLGDFSAPTF